MAVNHNLHKLLPKLVCSFIIFKFFDNIPTSHHSYFLRLANLKSACVISSEETINVIKELKHVGVLFRL